MTELPSIKHGYTAYTRGCRCDVCRQAKADYMRARRAESRKQANDPKAPVRVAGITHGRYGWEERGCRCLDCVGARNGMLKSLPGYGRRNASR